jgi:DNA-directed RNA polymerase III subunit RPC3
MQTTIRPSKGPEAAKLGLKLIEWNFGPLCRDVVKSLVHHGRQTLPEIIWTSNIKKPHAVRTALLVLIQQNCVTVNAHLLPNGKEEYLYEADLPRTLHIIRIPLFLSVLNQTVSLELQDTSKIVLQTLFHHGRMTIASLIEKTRDSMGIEEGSDDGSVRTVVCELIHRKLLERAPRCSLPPAPDTIHLKARKKRSGTRSNQDDDEELSINISRERIRLDHSAYRFAIPEGDLPSGMKKTNKKRKQGDDSPVLWRVNFEELNRRVYNSITVRIMKDTYGETTGKVIEAMLFGDVARDDQDLDFGGVIPNMSDSSFMDFSGIHEASKQIHATPLTTAEIRDALAGCMDPDTVICSTSNAKENKLMPSLSSCVEMGASKSFKFRTPRALLIARNSSLLAIIEQRFGPSAKRIWNMLHVGGQMEQKAIATESMLHNGEAREVLYAMLRNGFVTLQDVPRNADRAPSRTFFTWRASLETANIRATTMLYRTANNLLSRMAHETTTNAELLRRVHLVNQGRMDASQLDAAQLHKLKATVRITESALIDIDSQIAIFSCS